MRRGYSFEHQLDKLIDYINKAGYHAHKNHVKRADDGTYLQGEPYDYEIFTDDYKACFDAKESQQKSWNLSNAKLTQVENLKHCKNAGMDAFFLVYYYPNKQYIKFDVDFVINCLKEGKKSLKMSDGEVWHFVDDFRNKIEDQLC